MWKRGSFFQFDHCFSLNFGYMDNELPIPQFAMAPESNMTLNSTYADAPNRCYIVMVGGKYLQRIGAVMEKVNSIDNDVGRARPLAVFIISNDYKDNVTIDVNHGFERLKLTPVMVEIIHKSQSYHNFKMTQEHNVTVVVETLDCASYFRYN